MNQHCDKCGLIDYLYRYRGLELCLTCYTLLNRIDDEELGRDEDEQS